MKMATNGPSRPKKARAHEGPLGPSLVTFFGLMFFGFMAENWP